jgi:hypothetical protein
MLDFRSSSTLLRRTTSSKPYRGSLGHWAQWLRMPSSLCNLACIRESPTRIPLWRNFFTFNWKVGDIVMYNWKGFIGGHLWENFLWITSLVSLYSLCMREGMVAFRAISLLQFCVVHISLTYDQYSTIFPVLLRPLQSIVIITYM